MVLADDSYGELLKQQLMADYALTDLHQLALGESQLSHWVFPLEASVSHLPFQTSLRLMLKKAPESPYACSLRVPIDEPLEEDASYLLSLWMRCRSQGAGMVAHGVEYAQEPYTNLLWYECQPCEGWRQWWFPFKSPQSFPGGETRYQLLFQKKAQEIELGGLVVFKLAKGTSIEQLPNSKVYPAYDEASPLIIYQPDAFFSHVEEKFPASTFDSLLPRRQTETFDLAKPTPNLSLSRSETVNQEFDETLVCTTSPDALEERRVVSLPLPGAFEKGENLVLKVSIRNVHPAQGVVNHLVQLPLTDSPLLSVHQPLKSAWQHLEIPFEAAESARNGQAVYRLIILGESPVLELGGMALLNGKDTKPALEEITEASQPISPCSVSPSVDMARRGDLSVRVLDATGQPVQEARVEIRQKSHKFGLGTSVQEDLLLKGPDDIYGDRLINLAGPGRGFNRAFPEWHLNWMCWDEWNQPLGKARDIQLLRWLTENELQIRGHYLVSGNAYHLPTSVQFHRRNVEVLTDAIERRLVSALSFPVFEEHISEWDLFNEPFMVHDLWNIIGESGVVRMFQLAASLQPQTRFFVNQNQLMSVGGLDLATVKSTRRLMEALRDKTDAKLGLGIQAHFRGFLPSNDHLVELIEALSDPGWDIRVTEWDVAGVSEDEAGEFADRFCRLIMGKPTVKGIDLWGFWDGASWCQDALLFREDWSLKPAGEVFLQRFFKDWWTDSVVSTNGDGWCQERVFLGRHGLSISHGDLQKNLEVDIEEASAEFVVRLGLPERKPEPLISVASPAKWAPEAALEQVAFWTPEAEEAIHYVGAPYDDCILQAKSELQQFISWIKEQEIDSYLEIGCWTGRLISLLDQLFQFENLAVCDMGWAQQAGLQISLPGKANVLWGDSSSDAFLDWRASLGMVDLTFIDGDHSYEGVSEDFQRAISYPHKFVALHDIASPSPDLHGVPRFWRELKGNKIEFVCKDWPKGIGIWWK